MHNLIQKEIRLIDVLWISVFSMCLVSGFYMMHYLFSNAPMELFLVKRYVSRCIFDFIKIQSVIFVLLYYRVIARIVIEFFSSKTHPVNLAVFRGVIFWFLFNQGLHSTYFYSEFPEGLLFIPQGLEGIIPHIPISLEIVQKLVPIFKFFCFTAMIGLASRSSALIATLLGLYLLGIPQLYGKINHSHHMMWFAMILASSRCGDALSVDLLIKRWRQKSRLRFSPSEVYTVPIRLVWILIGYLYFSAGFWKWWISGIEWVFSDNLINRMYLKWMEFPGWTPAFRLDQFPVLCQYLALGVILFELTFIIFIFLPRWRYVSIFGGLLFHNMTWMFLRIQFLSLQYCYVIFFDWYKIFQGIKAWFFRKSFFSQRWKEKGEHIQRTCTTQSLSPSKKSLGLTIFVGLILIIGNFYCGAHNIHSWPFSCYPTFDSAFTVPLVKRIEVIVTTSAGKNVNIRNLSTKKKFSPSRLRGMMVKILNSKKGTEQKRRLEALWELFRENEPSLKGAKSVRFYRDIISVKPEDLNNPPLSRKLIYEILP